MTKTQIWTAVFLGLFIALFFLQRATKKETVPVEDMPVKNDSEYSAGEVSASDLIASFGCKSCHGQDLKGTNLAPTLIGLSEFYDRDNLINYLRNPSSYLDIQRFKDYKEKYKNLVCRLLLEKNKKDIGKIANYIVKLS